MLGRITGIVCLAVAFAPAGIATQAHAQSMDAMSLLTLSNRYISPMTQYQPVSFTADNSQQTASGNTAFQTSATASSAKVRAVTQAKPEKKAERQTRQSSEPR